MTVQSSFRPSLYLVTHEREFVYIDFLAAPIDTVVASYVHAPTKASKPRKGPRGGVLEPFPIKLYEMLITASKEEGMACIIAWKDHGRTFEINHPDAFLSHVMPRFFKHTKITSFQRQLNLYGFHRVFSGADKGSYCHPMFLRGRPDLCKVMIRSRLHPWRHRHQEQEATRCTSLSDIPWCPAHHLSGFNLPVAKDEQTGSPIDDDMLSSQSVVDINRFLEKQSLLDNNKRNTTSWSLLSRTFVCGKTKLNVLPQDDMVIIENEQIEKDIIISHEDLQELAIMKAAGMQTTTASTQANEKTCTIDMPTLVSVAEEDHYQYKNSCSTSWQTEDVVGMFAGQMFHCINTCDLGVDEDRDK